jgi:hypothetical protein
VCIAIECHLKTLMTVSYCQNDFLSLKVEALKELGIENKKKK